MNESSMTQDESDSVLFPGAITFIFWIIILSIAGLTFFLPLGFLTEIEQLLLGLPAGFITFYFAYQYAIQNCRQFHYWLFKD